MSFIFTYQNSYLDISNYMCIPHIIDISKIILLLKIQINNQINYHFKHNLYFNPHFKRPFNYHIKSNISNNTTNSFSINISSYSCHVIWHAIWSTVWYVQNEIYFLIRNLKCNFSWTMPWYVFWKMPWNVIISWIMPWYAICHVVWYVIKPWYVLCIDKFQLTCQVIYMLCFANNFLQILSFNLNHQLWPSPQPMSYYNSHCTPKAYKNLRLYTRPHPPPPSPLPPPYASASSAILVRRSLFPPVLIAHRFVHASRPWLGTIES